MLCKMSLIQDQKKVVSENETTKNKDWLEQEHETILLYGAPKVGKTWAYCSIIAQFVGAGNKVFIINTDGGISKTFKQHFGDQYSKVSKSIHYHFTEDMQQVIDAVESVKSQASSNDLIILDLVSDFWELAQHKFMEEASGGDVVSYIRRMSENKKSFGLFEGSKWQYIKKLDNYVLEKLVVRPTCNVVGVAAEKDIDIDKAFGGKQRNMEWAKAGARPAGQPQLSYKFNTVVYIGRNSDKRYFQIMGDRGAPTQQNIVSYGDNFWEKFTATREKGY